MIKGPPAKGHELNHLALISNLEAVAKNAIQFLRQRNGIFILGLGF